MIASSPSTEQRLSVPTFEGGAQALMDCADRECCMDGPAGTGKTFAALWKMHLRRVLFPGSRGLLARKTLISLKSSTLVTYRERVAAPLLASGHIKYWTAKADEPAHYAYWNGSKAVIVGLDKPGKAMSTEYDDVLVDEALDTEEADIEALLSRIQRPGHLYGVEGRPPFAQLVLLTNPGASLYWLNQRMVSGRTTRILSRHEDNPAMTAEYLAMLDRNLTGVRRLRLFSGTWAAAEGMVYEDSWDRARNVVDRLTVCAHTGLLGDCGIPRDWPRYISVDFGFTHPFVLQWWAQDPDGRFIRYREIYRTRRLVEDHARDALEVMGYRLESGQPKATMAHADPLPRALYCDHDAEDRHTLMRYMGLFTLPAYKDVSDGIQAVAARLRPAGDGRPRAVLLRDSLVERDPLLEDAKLPTCTEDEIEGYVWDVRNGRAKGDQPVKDNDHGVDAMRYQIATCDRRPGTVGMQRFTY